ncbi:hypothetical protein JL720_979 [Aureococcus anophagefferens]|nr:hypothetical protein JL720_979 [Aureococcus anophagefferens]
MSRPDWCSRVERARQLRRPRPLPKRAEYVPKATERRPARAIVDSNKPKSMNAPIRKITQQRVATGVDVRAARISNAATRAQKRGPHKAVSKPRGRRARRRGANAAGGGAALAARRSTSAAAGRARAAGAPSKRRAPCASTARALHAYEDVAEACAAFGAPLSLDVDDAKAPAPAGDDRLVTAVDGRTVEFSGLAHGRGPCPRSSRVAAQGARNAPRGKATRTITWDQLKKNYDPRDEWQPGTYGDRSAGGDDEDQP